MIRHLLPLALALAGTGATAASQPGDVTATALEQCLASDRAQSTAGQTDCTDTALRSYDRRMNRAYSELLRRLPKEPAAQLRAAQRAWLTFRTADDRARAAAYETREGTMYVPMQANAAAIVVRDRAIQLEGLLRVLTIDAD